MDLDMTHLVASEHVYHVAVRAIRHRYREGTKHETTEHGQRREDRPSLLTEDIADRH